MKTKLAFKRKRQPKPTRGKKEAAAGFEQRGEWRKHVALVQLKAISLLHEAFPPTWPPRDQAPVAWELAQRIEHCLYVKHGQMGREPFDPAKARRLRDYNRGLVFVLGLLKSDPHLMRGLLDGDTPPQRLAGITPADVAASRAPLLQTRRADVQAQQRARKGMFRCRDPRCRSWETDYCQLQSRSADEGMTTFVTCLACGSRFKF